jgi:hypothetical protein
MSRSLETMTKKSTASLSNSRIDHYEYGPGTVVDVNERYTTIDFDEAGTKKFITDMVKLKPSDTPAPAKKTRAKKKTTKKTKATKKTAEKTAEKTTKKAVKKTAKKE